MSLVAVVEVGFMNGGQADQYFGSKHVTVWVQRQTTAHCPRHIRIKRVILALGGKAVSCGCHDCG